MSYLLTEIALEMLGYKFYDINGIYGPTHFHESTNDKTVTTEEVGIESKIAAAEESLQTLLELNEAPSEEINGLYNGAVNDQRQQYNNTLEVLLNDAIPTLVSSNTNEVSSQRDSEKLLHYESGKIREQLLGNQKLFLKSNPDILRRLEQSGANSTQDILQSYINNEKQNLEFEIQISQKFRHLVEKRLMKISSSKFEKYTLAFESNRSTTKK